MTDLQNINKDFVKDTIDSFSKKEFFGSTREDKMIIDHAKQNLNRKDVKLMTKSLQKNMFKSLEQSKANTMGSHNGLAKHFIVERMRQKLADKKGLKIN